jgi:hypothetical protein
MNPFELFDQAITREDYIKIIELCNAISSYQKNSAYKLDELEKKCVQKIEDIK